MCYGSQLWRTVVDGEGIVSTGPVVVRLARRGAAHEPAVSVKAVRT